MVMGTSTYMPPEQARAQWKMVDSRSDIWAIGATMFRALTGRHVHHAAVTQIERMLAAMSQHAPPLASVAPSVPDGVALLIDRALAFQRRDRWTDARAMQKALRYAYRDLEKMGAPPLAPSAPVDTNDDQAPVSIRFEDSIADRSVNVIVDTSESHADSIVVEISDEHGTPQKYELEKAAAAAGDDLMEITAVSTVIEGGRR
jgi:serine/threonine protein kinase